MHSKTDTGICNTILILTWLDVAEQCFNAEITLAFLVMNRKVHGFSTTTHHIGLRC